MPLLSVDQMDRVAAGEGASLAGELDATVPAEWLATVGRLAELRARQAHDRPVDAPWLLRAIVRSEPGVRREVIGYANFHGAPDDSGQVEIGYTLLPGARGALPTPGPMSSSAS